MEQKHTPTPWVLNHTTTYDLHFVTDENSRAICDLYYKPTDTDHYRFENAPANAEFIVRACNAHDDLVAAIEDIKDEFQRLKEAVMVNEKLSFMERMRDALYLDGVMAVITTKSDAAIAKAKAPQS